jgi:hypothetical protein
MGIAFGWLLFAIIVGVAAGGRGRSGVAWFLLSIVLSPLLMAILLALLPRLVNGLSPEEMAAEDARQRVKCPECAELVMCEAKICKHCGARFQLAPPTYVSPVPQTPPLPAGVNEPRHRKYIMLVLLALGISWLLISLVSHIR